MKNPVKQLWRKLIHERRRKKHDLPKTVNRLWLAGEYNRRKNDEETKYDLPYFDDDGSYINYTRGDHVTLVDEDGWEAIYEITAINGGPADTLGWDDNRKYDLEFRRVNYNET